MTDRPNLWEGSSRACETGTTEQDSTKRETSRLRKRRLPRTKGPYPVLSPVFRFVKVVTVRYYRLDTATQVLLSAQVAYSEFAWCSS